MRVHHLNCGTLCPHGRRLIDGEGGCSSRPSLVCHCLLIETDDGLVLVDTGFGIEDARNPGQLGAAFELMRPERRASPRPALKQVEALGFAAGDVRQHRRHPPRPRPLRRPARLPRGRGPRLRAASSRRRSTRSLQRAAALPRPPLGSTARTGSGTRSSGDEWFGFEGVSDPARHSAPRCCWSRSPATRAATSAVAIRDGEGWLLHCGDAYFHHGEIATPPSCPPGLRFFQNLNSRRPQASASQPGAAARAGRPPRRRGHAASARTTRTSWSASRRRQRRGGLSAADAREALGAVGRAGRALPADRVHALARGRARPRASTTTTSSGAGRSTTSRASGPRSGTSSGSGPTASAGAVLGSREMPGAEWFAGTSLNYAEHVFAGKDDAEIGDPARLRAARARRAELGRAARPGRRRRRRPARARGRARRPRRRLHAEHPRGDRRLPRHRLDRRGLVELLARLRPGQRDRPLRPDRAQGPLRGRRLPLRRQGLRPPRGARRAAGGDADPGAHRRPPLPRPRPRPLGAARRDPLGRAARRRRGRRARASSASPSTTRSGSSTPPARPACRKRSSRARAGSCSST